MNRDNASGALRRIQRAYKGDTLTGVLARGGTWSFVFRVTTAGIATLTQIALVSILGEQDYGRYSYVFGWLQIVTVVTVFNFDYVSVKYVSMYFSARKCDLLRGFERTAVRFSGILSMFVGGSLAVTIWWTAPRMAAQLQVPAIIACAMLPVSSAVVIGSHRLRGRKLIAQSHVHELLRPVTLLTIVAALFFFSHQPIDLAQVFLANFTALSIAAVLNTLLVRRASVATRHVMPRYRYKEWFGTAAGLIPASFAQLALSFTTDIVIVGTLVGTTAAGVYAIAVMLLTPFGFVTASMGEIAAPLIADLYDSKRLEELRGLMTLVARVNIGLTVPMVLGLYIVSPPLLSWLGPTFRSGYPIVVILGIASMTATLGGHAALMLTMTGHHNRASVIIGASAVLNLVLALALGYPMGAIGVAAATTIATVTRNVSLTIEARRLTGVSLMPF